MIDLPIEPLRPSFLHAVVKGHVMLSAPTGSGKSTRAPVWAMSLGRVLVIEPRRVACRSLAVRVAHTVGCTVGDTVGYRVRDEDSSSVATKILFVTPGVALKMMNKNGSLAEYDVVILDEFHERTLDIDVIFAVLASERKQGFVVMSATIDGERVARHLNGPHLQGDGRTYPVDIRYVPTKNEKPSVDNLAERLIEVLTKTEARRGDALVFLPGKREIRACASALSNHRLSEEFEVLELHGELSLALQQKVFTENGRRKIILSTNVAETSITVPGVTLVIDSGLVRRTRYYDGRGFLTLMPIALDSAEQRRGRAGRVEPGLCVRLWSSSAKLLTETPPEIFRESLMPLVFHCAALGIDPVSLRFLDTPHVDAVAEAQRDLWALDALDSDGQITETGRALVGLPIDLTLARLIVGASRTNALVDMVDLVATLCVNRPFFVKGKGSELTSLGCDVEARIKGLRADDLNRYGISPEAQREARRIRARLARSVRLPPLPPLEQHIDRRSLALASLRSDRRMGYVARHRGRRTSWSNGGTERSLSRNSALAQLMDDEPTLKLDALIAFESRAVGRGEHDGEVMLTVVMPAHLKWLEAAGLGRDHVSNIRLVGCVLHAEIERRHAKKCLGSRLVVPTGVNAVDALVEGVRTGQVWQGLWTKIETKLERWRLARALNLVHVTAGSVDESVDSWLKYTLEQLGFETGADFGLLDAQDLEPDSLPSDVENKLNRTFPQLLQLPDATFRIRYDVRRKTAYLHPVSGRKGYRPTGRMLPRLDGYRVVLCDHRGESMLRSRC